MGAQQSGVKVNRCKENIRSMKSKMGPWCGGSDLNPSTAGVGEQRQADLCFRPTCLPSEFQASQSYMVMPFSEKEKNWRKKRNGGIGARKHSCIKSPPSTRVLFQSLGTSAVHRHDGNSTSLFIVLKAIIFALCLGATPSTVAACMAPCGHVSQVLWGSAKRTPIPDPWGSKSLLFWNTGFLCCFFFCNFLFRNKTYRRKMLL